MCGFMTGGGSKVEFIWFLRRLGERQRVQGLLGQCLTVLACLQERHASCCAALWVIAEAAF